MKTYLLKPHKRLEIAKEKVWVVRGGFHECWPFIKDKYFFCVHFKYDSQLVLKGISDSMEEGEELSEQKINKFIEESDICLGILTKRGNASVKSMLKVYKLENIY